MSSNESDEIIFIILIVGDSSVGKTSLYYKYIEDFFPENYVKTRGIDNKTKKIKLKEVDIKLEIWDTEGQQKFKGVTNNFLNQVDGIMFVYDLTQSKTFDYLKNWIAESEISVGTKKIIIGNKKDLVSERQISEDSLTKFCDEKGLKRMEVSAKDGTNVDEAFKTLAELIVEEKTKDELIKTYTKNARIRLKDDEGNKRGCCC